MKRANYAHLVVLLGPFAGGADDDDAMQRFGGSDLDDETDVRVLAVNLLKPHFETFEVESQHRLLESLGYYLSNPRTDFGKVADSVLVPFDVTARRGRALFEALWSSVAPEQSFVVPLDLFEEVDDPEELRQLKRRG